MVQAIDKQIAAIKRGEKDPEHIHELAQDALAWARQITKEKGEGSSESASAWDTVEELLAAIAHRRNQQQDQNSLDRYCNDHPEAEECKVYDL
ncbi:MAG: hypothetical protein F6K45_16210 [Kamptonema sp. SIO1D9]|nr:hypothetical protein [Kamptonema sp. SIO1D9]